MAAAAAATTATAAAPGTSSASVATAAVATSGSLWARPARALPSLKEEEEEEEVVAPVLACCELSAAVDSRDRLRHQSKRAKILNLEMVGGWGTFALAQLVEIVLQRRKASL